MVDLLTYLKVMVEDWAEVETVFSQECSQHWHVVNLLQFWERDIDCVTKH